MDGPIANLFRKDRRGLLACAAALATAAGLCALLICTAQPAEPEHGYAGASSGDPWSGPDGPAAPSIAAWRGDRKTLLTAASVFLAVTDMAGDNPENQAVTALLENWNAARNCQIQGYRPDTNVMNIVMRQCLHHAAMTAPLPPDAESEWDRARRLEPAYRELNEITIAALDPTSWYPEDSSIFAPCREKYRRAAKNQMRPEHAGHDQSWRALKQSLVYCVAVRSPRPEPPQPPKEN